MFYVPLLKWKAGEQQALCRLSDDIKNCITPLIEIVPTPWDFENDCPGKTVDEHLSKVPETVSKAWGTRPIFIDLGLIAESDRMADGTHPLSFVVNTCRELGVNPVPVTSPSRDESYQRSVIDAYHADQLGVCIRLSDEDFSETGSSIVDLLRQLEIPKKDVHIMIDLGYIDPGKANISMLSVVAVLNSIPDIAAFRSVALAGTAFPMNLSALPSKSIQAISRAEWSVWTGLRKLADKGNIVRLPCFGDYAISSPELLLDVDPRVMRRTANIRYTSSDQWLVIKGSSVRKEGAQQMHDLCRKLVANAAYSGPDFSWGDSYIWRCAENVEGPGNATTWRAVGTNHHITYVVGELASLCGI